MSQLMYNVYLYMYVYFLNGNSLPIKIVVFAIVPQYKPAPTATNTGTKNIERGNAHNDELKRIRTV